MSSLFPDPISASSEPQPVWDIATLYPLQGGWSEEEYLALTDSTNRLIELTDGRLEFLEMPTEAHQLIMAFLFESLRDFVKLRDAGLVLFMGLRVRIRPQKLREPDVLFIAKENYGKRNNRYWSGADLVMEVVSPDDQSRERDLTTKVLDYAEAGIAEYWIVDPQAKRITVLHLAEDRGRYDTHGVFEPGEAATSTRLAGFSVDVAATFAAAEA